MGESGRGGKRQPLASYSTYTYINITNSSSRSPSLDCRIPRSVLACVLCEMGSWRSVLRNQEEKQVKEYESADLDIQFPEVIEEHFDSIVVLCLVQDDKLHVCFIHKKNTERPIGEQSTDCLQ